MLKVYNGLVVCLLMGGCYTQFKATKQVGKALANYPQIVARIAQDSFPCNVIRIDTNISVSNYDTTLLLDCPVRDTVPNSVLNSVPNSVLNSEKNTISKKVNVKLPYKTVSITKVLESTARLVIIRATLDSLNNSISELQKKNDSLVEKVGRKNKAIYWLIAFLVGISIPYIIRIFKIFIK